MKDSPVEVMKTGSQTNELPVQNADYSVSAHLYSFFTGILFLFTGLTEKQTRKRVYSETLGIEPSERILDICCANGSSTRQIADMAPKNEIFGIDLSPAMIAFAYKKSKNYPKVKYRVGDCSKIPFPEGSFDLVTATLALHELPTTILRKTIQEIKRILKPTGRLYIFDFNMPSEPPFYLRFFYYGMRLVEDESAARFMMVNQSKVLARDGFQQIFCKEYFGGLMTASLYRLAD